MKDRVDVRLERWQWAEIRKALRGYADRQRDPRDAQRFNRYAARLPDAGGRAELPPYTPLPVPEAFKECPDCESGHAPTAHSNGFEALVLALDKAEAGDRRQAMHWFSVSSRIDAVAAARAATFRERERLAALGKPRDQITEAVDAIEAAGPGAKLSWQIATRRKSGEGPRRA